MGFEGIVVFDARLRSILRADSTLERLCTGAIWSEGPVWIDARQALVWSDIPNNRMLAWSTATGMTVFRAPSNFSNGNTLDREGRIVTCEHGRRCVSPHRPRLAASRSSSTATRGAASIRPMTSSSSPTAPSGSPTRHTAS